MDIYKPDNSFDFNSITLANPQPVQTGSFFTKLSVESNKPLYIQLPKCITKQNIVEALRGKYCDLMYERNDGDELMNWIEKFEHACQDKINDKKSLWFQTDLSRDDIETMMSPITRLYKSGKYILIRTYLNTSKHTGKDKCIAYDDNEMPIDLDKINSEKYIIPLILIDGIKFSSRSFEIDIKLIQLMVIDPPPIIKETIPLCLIKNKNGSMNNNINTNNHENQIISTETLLNSTNSTNSTNNNIIQVSESTPLVEVLEKQVLEKQISEKQYSEKPVPEKQDNLEKQIQPSYVLDGIEEVELNFDDIKESITIKKPNDVYYEIYKAAREKAKHMKKVAIEAYLEAKEIKTKYMLSNIEDSEEEDDIED